MVLYFNHPVQVKKVPFLPQTNVKREYNPDVMPIQCQDYSDYTSYSQNKIHRYYAELFISNMLFCSSFQQDVVYSLSAVYSISNVHQQYSFFFINIMLNC